jgi:thioredoxin 1
MATKHINTVDFQNEVLDFKGTVMVDFYAEWCGPCKITSPIIDQLNDEFGQKVKFLKVDVDQNNDLAGQFNVFSIPTFIIFKDGKAVGQLVGAQSKDAFKAELSKITPL